MSVLQFDIIIDFNELFFPLAWYCFGKIRFECELKEKRGYKKKKIISLKKSFYHYYFFDLWYDLKQVYFINLSIAD
jgi:hypothetical protein